MKVAKESKIFVNIQKFDIAVVRCAKSKNTPKSVLMDNLGIAKGYVSNMTNGMARYCEAEKKDVPSGVGCMSRTSFFGYCAMLGLNADDFIMSYEEVFKKEEPVVADNNELLAEIKKLNTNIEGLIHAVNSIGKLVSANVDNTHNILMNTRQLMANTRK